MVVSFALIEAGSIAIAQDPECDGMVPPQGPGQDASGLGPVPPNCFGGGAPGPSDCTDDGCVIDIAVIYSVDARDGALGIGKTMAEISQEAVDATNVAYARSGITTQARLVATFLDEEYVQAGSSGDALTHLRTPGDGKLDAAFDLREDSRADVVVFIGEGYRGVATFSVGVAGLIGFPEDAFAVVGRARAALSAIPQ